MQQIWTHDRGEEALPFSIQTIGKNGSTRLHKWLNHYQFSNCTYDQVVNSQYHKDNIVYIIIQDPVVKFIKGFSEMISNLRPAYEVGAINNQPRVVQAHSSTAHIIFKEILTKMSEETMEVFLFQFLQHIDMYKFDYHVELQTKIIAYVSNAGLDFEVLSISDIDNFHNIVKEKHAKHFAERVDGLANGLIPIDPERIEKNARLLIEDITQSLVYKHIDGELSNIKEYLQPDIGLWQIFKNQTTSSTY